MNNTLKIFTLLALLNTAIAAPMVLQSDSTKGAVQFEAIGKPDFLKIKGKGAGPVGQLSVDGKQLSGDLTFDLRTLDTGIETRDKHMKEKYLKTAANPLSILVIEKTELNEAFDAAKNILKGDKFTGKLTLNGVTKDIAGTWSAKNDGISQKVTSNFTVKLTDFSIEIPSFAGITVADEVKLQVEALLVPQTQTTNELAR